LPTEGNYYIQRSGGRKKGRGKRGVSKKRLQRETKIILKRNKLHAATCKKQDANKGGGRKGKRKKRGKRKKTETGVS